MRRSILLLWVTFAAGLVCCACAKPDFVRSNPRLTFSEAKTNPSAYKKKAAIVAPRVATTPYAQTAETILSQQIIETIRNSDHDLILLDQKTNQLPDYLKTSNLFIESKTVYGICEKARSDGFQFLLQARVLNVAPQKRERGIWWFRKMRYYIAVDLGLDIYDAITAAKLMNQVKSTEVEVRQSDYEEMVAGHAGEIREVNELVADMAQTLGHEAISAIRNAMWMAPVIDIQDNRIIFAVAGSAGVKVGDHWMIFEGRRVVTGAEGEQYIAPGYKLADARVVAVEQSKVIATVEGQNDIRPGDIGCPSR
ncbi:MAG: hypothetical protein M0036_21970 [Desulfobacteraceae bacterium]|nr:hypothetical protein [Desulfobacteraceae bacterium]